MKICDHCKVGYNNPNSDMCKICTELHWQHAVWRTKYKPAKQKKIQELWDARKDLHQGQTTDNTDSP